MKTVLTIKPARESNIIKSLKPSVMAEGRGPNGVQEMVKVSDNYDGKVIPGTGSGIRIKWDANKRRYDIGDISEEDLNKIVADCKLVNDRYGHPDKGKLITKADPSDWNDPFFTNRKLTKVLIEREGTLDSTNAIEKMFIQYVRANSMDFSIDGGTMRSATYEIIDTNRSLTKSQKIRSKSQTAIKLFENLSDAKKVQIAMYLGLIPSEKTDRALIDDALWKICIGTDYQLEVKRDAFISLAELATEKLSNRYLIAKAKKFGKLKKTKQGFLLNGVSIGNIEEDVANYFDDINNQDVISNLEKTLNG